MIAWSRRQTYHLHHDKAMTGLEVCGYVDVKIPSRGRKFGQWRTWRRQWCIVRHGSDNTLQLVLGTAHNSPTSVIDIPYNAVLCRSESRSRMFAFGIFCASGVARLRQPVVFLAGHSEVESQRWMLQIRNLICPPNVPVEAGEFSVSLIDNEHSRTAGLAGLYGTLSTSFTGITVSDSLKGQIRVHWRWSQLDSVILHDKHVLVIHTSREFSSGEGEIKLFCHQGSELEVVLSKYLTKPTFRLVSSPLPPIPGSPLLHHALLASRRRSRSEGDLHCWSQQDSLFHLRTQSMTRKTSHEKIASGVVSAGLGLLLSTPGCSEPDSLHDYQCLDSLWPDPENSEDTLSDLPEFRRFQFKSERRESGVSIASGVYEEIEESPETHCETTCQQEPPPLPPRKLESNESEESSVPDEIIYSVADETEEESLYLPMSPRGHKEETYVVMANLLNKNSISGPVV